MVLYIQVRMTFYFKASDLGEYILFDQDSKYLTYNTFNAIVRNTTLSDRTRFKVEQYEDNSFSFYSYVKKKYVGIKGTSLVWKDNVDDTCRFELELTEGNNPFPEADVNIDFYDEDGNPITTSNVMARPSSGENISGTAILMHICVITKDLERLYLMEMHLVPWELQMHSMIVRICME